MKFKFLSFFILLLLTISCSTGGFKIRSLSGYEIKTINLGGRTDKVYCNKEEAFTIFSLNGINYRAQVWYNPSTGNFFVSINNKYYNVKTDNILPDSISKIEYDKVVKQTTGFDTYAEYDWHRKQQQELEEEARKAEHKRLSDEIDKKYGVVGVIREFGGSEIRTNDDGTKTGVILPGIQNSSFRIGAVYRLYDPLRIDLLRKLDANTYVRQFHDGYEYIIRGNGIFSADVRDVYVNLHYYGKKSYLLRYLGMEQVITRAMLVKVVHVFEYVAGNKYAEEKEEKKFY